MPKPSATPIKKLRDTIIVEEETIRSVRSPPADDSDNDVFFTEDGRVVKELPSPKAVKREQRRRLEECTKQLEQKPIKPLKFVSRRRSPSPKRAKKDKARTNSQEDWDNMMERRRRTLGKERKKEEKGRQGEEECGGLGSPRAGQRREEGIGSAHVYRAHLMGSP